MQAFHHHLLRLIQLTRRDAPLLVKRAVSAFVEDRCPQMASSISYWVFFSIFPLAIFLVTITGQFLRDEDLKNRVIDALLEVLPLAPVEGREQLENVLAGVSTDVSLLGLASVIGLLWSASAMMTAVRISVNVAWDHGYRRPPVRGKLVDIAMVFSLGVLVAMSLIATTVMRIGTSIADAITFLPVGWAWGVAGLLMPFLISFTIFTLIYTFVPAIDVKFSQIWPGVLFAAIAFETAKHGFAFYVANFGNYNAIYGSLGAIIVFLVFVYLTANILLFGAELASEWPRVQAGHYDDLDNSDDVDDDRTNFERARDLAGSLIFMDPHERSKAQRDATKLARAQNVERAREAEATISTESGQANLDMPESEPTTPARRDSVPKQ
jgi:membrane protein